VCIAIYKPKGANIPKKSILRTCWDNNPDGAGYLYSTGEGYQVHKGFMSFKAFWESFSNEGFNQYDTIGIHFRVGTSGRRDGRATHPFPISNNISDLQEEHYTAKQCFIHNGIISSGSQLLSDTQLFSKDVLWYLRKYLTDTDVIEYIKQQTIGSRLALFLEGEQVILTGNWIKDEKTGVYYSNNSYQPSYKRFRSSGCLSDVFDWKDAWNDGGIGDETETDAESLYSGTWDDNCIDSNDRYIPCPACGYLVDTWNDVICKYCGADLLPYYTDD